MTKPLQRLRRFLAELKRRNVYRVAATYAVVGFVLIQVADLTFVRLGLPSWTVTLVIVLVAMGFPLALVLAWAFERTPEGMRRTSGADASEEASAEGDVQTGYKALVGLGLVAAAVVGGWYLTGGGGESPEVTEGTVAVFPFQVSGPDTESWREGMVTMLGTGLDGAAGLRAIADQTALAGWERAGQATAGTQTPQFLDAARRVGAQYAIIGSAAKLGGELQLSADVHETSSGDRLGQVEVRGSPGRITALTDSLTRRVLSVLLEESEAEIPSVDLASVTTQSLPALKSYLAGERHFRSGEYEAAIEDYEAAVEQDSSFALAYARLHIAKGWGGDGGRREDLLRAYEFLHRLPPRERRVVRARYIRTVRERPSVAADTLRRLTQEYPDDPSVWYFLGETVFHGGMPGGWPEAETAFEDAVELDPSVAPYHHHLVDLAMSLHHDSALAARRIETHPGGPLKRWYQTLWDLNFGSTEGREDAWARIDTLTFGEGWWDNWPLYHPTNKALQEQVLEALLDRGEDVHFDLVQTRLQAGQIDEAISQYRKLSERQRSIFSCLLAESLTLGYPLPDSIVRARLDPSSISDGHGYRSILRLRCAGLYLIEQDRGDELEPVLKRLRSIPERPNPPEGIQSTVNQVVRSLKGYRAWSAGDLQTAAEYWSGFTIPRPYGAILRGDLHRELGQLEQAEDWYIAAWRHPVAHERLGQLYEEMERPEKAAAAYRRFVEAWEDADPELQPRVEAARKRLQELTDAEADTDE